MCLDAEADPFFPCSPVPQLVCMSATVEDAAPVEALLGEQLLDFADCRSVPLEEFGQAGDQLFGLVDGQLRSVDRPPTFKFSNDPTGLLG